MEMVVLRAIVREKLMYYHFIYYVILCMLGNGMCLCGYGSSAFPVYCGTGAVVCNNRPHTSSMCAFWLVI